MNFRISTLGIIFALATFAPAADPGWWAIRGVKNSSPASNRSPATIGQAKHMAAMALKELEQRLPAAEYLALKSAVDAVANLDVLVIPPGMHPAPRPPGYIGPNNHILLNGQLKALAKPFYDTVRAHDSAWLDAEMAAANIRVVEPGSDPASFSPYPWSVAASDDENKGMASVGQLKAVFSLRLETFSIIDIGDADGDGLPDDWEIAHGLDPNDSSDALNLFPGSDLTNLQAFNAGVQANPNATPTDKDGDGIDDNEDADSLDKAINWKRSAESAYIFLEIEDYDREIYGDPIMSNAQGRVLFSKAVWENDTWTLINGVASGFLSSNTWRYEIDGVMTDIKLGFNNVSPTSMDDDGTIVGTGSVAEVHHFVFELVKSLVWSSPGALPQLLGEPDIITVNSPVTPNFEDAYITRDGHIIGLGWYDGATSLARIFDGMSKGAADSEFEFGSRTNQTGKPSRDGTFAGMNHDSNGENEAPWVLRTVGHETWEVLSAANTLTPAPSSGPIDFSSEPAPGGTTPPTGKEPGGSEYPAVAMGGDFLIHDGSKWVKSESLKNARALSRYGTALTTLPGDNHHEPAVWRNGKRTKIKDLCPGLATNGISYFNPVDINDQGVLLIDAVNRVGLLLPVELISDYNRDGKIDSADRGKVTTEKPWRFWVNDDDDEGETQGTDIPVAYTNGGAQDLWQPGVDGIRDLIDFFPLHLNLKAALAVMPETEFQYFLKHDSMGSSVGSSFSVLWYPEAILDSDPKDATGAGSFLKNLTTAADIVARDLHPIPQDGLRIPDNALLAAKNGKGVALFEARMATDKPIQIEIRKNDGTVLGKVDFPVKVTPVQNMFRYKFVMPGAADLGAGDIPEDPPNWPDADRNGKHFVFAHGYNVNDTQSKGWAAEAFKRLFWSGSNARFTAFGWYGYQGQTFGITPGYQVNLDNAFATAKSFKQFLDLLEGDKTVAGHSMGNVLVGSAMHDWGARPKNYFMLNAAAAKEWYDPAEADELTQDAAMENQIWRGYPKILRASEWHRLLPSAAWPASDWRGKLTWRGRFANVIQNGGQTDVYNFYSSGEEVLNNPTLNTPQTNNAITEAWLKANRVWAVQEKRKGHGVTGLIHTSNYGGWRFNLMTANDAVIHDNSSGSTLMKTPAQLPDPLNNEFLLHLASNPFFDRSAHPALYEPETGSNSAGSNYAYNHRNTIMAEMIPCTSFAAGRNDFINAATLAASHNIDMNAIMKTDPDKWPLSNENENNKPPSDREARPWLHSDIREKAFTHNWKAYKKFVELGNLNDIN